MSEEFTTGRITFGASEKVVVNRIVTHSVDTVASASNEITTHSAIAESPALKKVNDLAKDIPRKAIIEDDGPPLITDSYIPTAEDMIELNWNEQHGVFIPAPSIGQDPGGNLYQLHHSTQGNAKWIPIKQLTPEDIIDEDS